MVGRNLLIAVLLTLLTAGCRGVTITDAEPSAFDSRVTAMRQALPRHFLDDALIGCTSAVDRPRAYGEPEPPEGFAGPDPDGYLPFGIYLPPDYPRFFPGDDISVYQWVFHEMFHFHNRRLHDYDRFIAAAFPTGHEPLVEWMRRDPYHQAFAPEEAFINLVTFADPAATPVQRLAVRDFFNYLGGESLSIEQLKELLAVIPHP